MRAWEEKIDAEHQRWNYELDTKPLLDALGVIPRIPPKTAAEAASLFDVMAQVSKRGLVFVETEPDAKH